MLSTDFGQIDDKRITCTDHHGTWGQQMLWPRRDLFDSQLFFSSMVRKRVHPHERSHDKILNDATQMLAKIANATEKHFPHIMKSM